MKQALFGILFFCGTLFCLDTQERITIALSLHDVHTARQLLEDLQKEDPHSQRTQELIFAYYAELNDFDSIQALYEKMSPEQKKALSPGTTEKIAWVIIEKALRSPHPRIRAEGAIAAAEAHDSKSAHILASLFTDSHAGVRTLAFQLARSYPDACVQERAEKLCTARIPELMMEAASLLAEQKATCAEKVLSKLIQDETLSESDLFQIIRLAASLKESDIEWIRKELLNPSLQTRALASAVVLEHPTREGLAALRPLLEDDSLLVRKIVMTTLGLYQGILPLDDKALFTISSSLSHPCLSIQATAAWALLLSPNNTFQNSALTWFQKNIVSDVSETRLTATSRLIASGERGLDLAGKILSESSDIYVKANLARYLLFHKKALKQSIENLREISTSRILFGMQEDGIFSWIGQASNHDPFIPRLPESEDLYLRLNLIALRHYSGDTIVKEELEKILHDRVWGLSAATAEFLFHEMLPLDEVLSPLLSNDEEIVRIQAALLLAIFSRSKNAALRLVEEYHKASKAGKEMLLLGFSAIPTAKTRDLLFPLLFDQSQTLRTRAAGVFLSAP